MSKHTSISSVSRRCRQVALASVVLPGLLLSVGCASTPNDPVAFVIEREAPAPSGYQAAIDANRIAVM